MDSAYSTDNSPAARAARLGISVEELNARTGGAPGTPGYTGSLLGMGAADVSKLLNPPDLFPDTSRMAAETSAARGVPGSPAAYSTAVRMTDEEKLRRIMLGLGALPQFTISPFQQAGLSQRDRELQLERDRLYQQTQQQNYLNQLRNQPSIDYPGSISGGGFGGGGYRGGGGFGGGGVAPSVDIFGNPTTAPTWMSGTGEEHRLPTFFGGGGSYDDFLESMGVPVGGPDTSGMAGQPQTINDVLSGYGLGTDYAMPGFPDYSGEGG